MLVFFSLGFVCFHFQTLPFTFSNICIYEQQVMCTDENWSRGTRKSGFGNDHTGTDNPTTLNYDDNVVFVTFELDVMVHSEQQDEWKGRWW
jgi:hypothetical protein